MKRQVNEMASSWNSKFMIDEKVSWCNGKFDEKASWWNCSLTK